MNVSNDRCGVRDIGDIETASEAVEVKYLPCILDNVSTVLPGGPGVPILTPDLRPPGEEALGVRQLVPARHARRARTRPRPRPAARPQQVAAAAAAAAALVRSLHY